ncbi:ATP-binding protein [Thiohalorhabdus sp. Cl-TMA]|uniref:histidine kinase n=1 Tax=Thiohalorhabdus methylotrophus TaxID=3242694 RepID=A0ABV4TYJ9_9GAMM
MISLKTRLTLSLSLALVILLGLQYYLVTSAIRSTAEDYVASRLEHDAETLLADLTWTEQGPQLPERTLDPVYLRPFSGHYFSIQTSRARLPSRSLWDTDLPVEPVAPGESRLLHKEGPAGQPLLVYSAGFRKGGRSLTLTVAEDLSSLNADLRAFQWRYTLVSVGIAAALLALQWVLVALGMRPLRRLQGELRAMEAGERQRLSRQVPAEVRPLATEINRLVEVMRNRLERSRNAVGNLAHALKTPLTRLTQLGDDPKVRSDPDLHEHLLEPSRTIGELIDRELKRARLAGGSPGQRFVADREIPRLIRALEGIHAERGVTIEARIPPGKSYHGDREDLLELFGNLLDNACKWAQSRVVLQVKEEPGLHFTVADDGPGIPEEARPRLTERGVRLDESTTGHGLGLAIVQDIVTAYDGTLAFTASEELGGLAIRVTLPPLS